MQNQLARYIQITSRREFQRLAACPPETLTDLERAARFLYLQKTAFGGKVTGRTFGIDKSCGARFDLTRLARLLEDVHERLTGVVIECLPWSEFIARWDRPGMLFYLDPPYFGSEADYGKGVFSADDFDRMADILSGIQGEFLLSINDRPKIRGTFSSFQIEDVSLTYSVNGGKGAPAKELIVTNVIAR
ncbi:DNA adenine methylase [Flavimaribacter sediminis]|nr:DNA adenine methylase [Flavimaribacter sediminis]